MRPWGVSTAPGPRTLGLLGACVAVVVAGALLARGGTAADDVQVREARASVEAVPTRPAPAPEPSAPLPAGEVVVRADGVDGLRLGMSAAELVTSGWSVQQQPVAGCRRVRPGLSVPGPGEGVSGWLVGNRVAAVTVTDGAGASSSFLGPGPGGRLADLPSGDGLRRSTWAVPVPWQPGPVLVDVARSDPAPGVRASFADLDADGTIDLVQVREDAAAGCPAAAEEQQQAEASALPELGLTGRGQLLVGTPLARAAQVARLAAGSATGTPPPCRLVLGEGEPGLLYVVVAADAAGQEVVRAVTVDAGEMASGLAVGDTAEQVARVLPGLTAAYLQERWRQGLSADWQVDGGQLRLWPRREQTPLTALDTVLVGPRDVVGLVQVGPGC